MLPRDVGYALRMLRKSPDFTLVALVTLALGIGANTAIFSVVNGVVLQPLDYADPERIVRVQTSWAGEPDAGISPAEYYDYRDRLDVFSSLGVYAFSSPSITGGDRPERLRGAFVSSGLLPALGVRLALGARARDVARLVLKHSLALTAAGVVVGLLLAAFLTRALAGMLYGVSPVDAWTFAGVPLALAAVALLAAWIPTWRASRIDPSEVLRHE